MAVDWVTRCKSRKSCSKPRTLPEAPLQFSHVADLRTHVTVWEEAARRSAHAIAASRRADPATDRDASLPSIRFPPLGDPRGRRQQPLRATATRRLVDRA